MSTFLRREDTPLVASAESVNVTGHRARSPATARWGAELRSAVTRQWSDPLARGGLSLLVNTGVTGIVGFGYWIIAARLFAPYTVGVAAALVAATTLFSSIGQLNMSGMLMRFLPKAGGRSRRLVLITYAVSASSSTLLAAISLTIIGMISTSRSPLRLDVSQSAVLVAAVAATAIFTLEDSALIALRRAYWVPLENGAFGLAKIVMIFVFAPVGTAFALFTAWMIPLTVTILLISLMIFGRLLPPVPRFQRRIPFPKATRSNMIRFAAGDAAGGLFTYAWTYLLPILITVSLGGTANALYFTSFLVANTIDQVAVNYAASLTVEGAHTPKEIAGLIRTSLRHIYRIILPIVAVLIVVSPWLLQAFGEKYVSASPLLRLLLIACIPKGISTVYYGYCRVRRTTYRSAFMQAYVCVATLAAAMLLARSYGLIGIGLAVIAVQGSAGVVSWWALRRGLSGLMPGANKRGRHRVQKSTADEVFD
jgi:O-antigen/teichoic acid export membrane protein